MQISYKRWVLLVASLAWAGVSYPKLAEAQHRINLNGADIRSFIRDAARITGRSFVIAPQVQGRVSVATDRSLSQSEYFELFLSVLRSNGFVAVPSGGGALRIQPAAGAPAAAPLVGSGAQSSAARFVTDILRVRNIDPAAAIETLRPIISREGSLTASPRAIVVSDFVDNVRRVRQILSEIDVYQATTSVITLRNAGAREIAQALTELSPQGVTIVPVDSANTIVLRGDIDAITRLSEVAQELDSRSSNGSALRVVFLEHADAEVLLPVLQQLLGQIGAPSPAAERQGGSRPMTSASRSAQGIEAASSRGSTAILPSASAGLVLPAARNAVVTRFEGANAIVISAAPDLQRMLGEVIRQLDIRREQVLVEAVIVEISEGAARRLGVQLFLAGLRGSNIPFAVTNYSNIAPSGSSVANAILDDLRRNPQNTPSRALAEQLRTAGVGGGSGGWAVEAGNALLGAIVNAVRADNESSILSTPSIMTLNNQEARILVGQEIPVTTGQALSPNFGNAFRTVQRQNVGISLEVRPQINAGGSIKLDLRQEVSSIAGPVTNNSSDLILNKREIETTITVDDGEIIGIGGLLDDNERRTLERIPLLGDIPVLGSLFRSRSGTSGRTNLMVFIRPTVLRSAADARAMGARRYGHIRRQQIVSNPGSEPSIDELVRDYLGMAPPVMVSEPTDQGITPPAIPASPPGSPASTPV